MNRAQIILNDTNEKNIKKTINYIWKMWMGGKQSHLSTGLQGSLPLTMEQYKNMLTYSTNYNLSSSLTILHKKQKMKMSAQKTLIRGELWYIY